MGRIEKRRGACKVQWMLAWRKVKGEETLAVTVGIECYGYVSSGERRTEHSGSANKAAVEAL